MGGQPCVHFPEMWEESTHPANEIESPPRPRSEFFIGSSVVLELRDGVEHTVKGATAGKALEEDAELLPCLLHDRIIAEHALSGTGLVLASRLGGVKVCFECVEEPGDRALVRGVGLALGNDLDKYAERALATAEERMAVLI